MSDIELDLRVADPQWNGLSDLEGLCARALAAGQGVACGAGGEVAVLLTGDEEMQALNRDWRGKDRATDVLSFPGDAMAPGFLGDIALGHGVCVRDAHALGRDLSAHLAHLLVHGLLHLYGHDHIEDTEAAEMQALEREALATLGLPDPYSVNN